MVVDIIRIGHIRTGRRADNKIHWCKCGRDMTFIKDVPAWNCLHCGSIEYLESSTTTARQAPDLTAQRGISGNSSTGLTSSDNLTDRQTRPNTSGRKFHSMKNPRGTSRYSKPDKPEIDDELQRILDSHPDYHLVKYVEHIEQSPDVLSPGERKGYKGNRDRQRDFLL